MKFATGSAIVPVERVRITSLGKVGIGTPVPNEKLHVSGNIQLGDNIGAVGTGTRIYFSTAAANSDTTSIYRVNTANDASILRFELGDNFGTGSGASSTADYFDFCATNNTANPTVRITPYTGNVGINVNLPISRLHVIADDTQTTNYAGVFLSNVATTGTSGITKKGLEITSTGAWTGTSNIGLHVSSVTGGTANYDAIFNGGGNVGIGNIKPRENFMYLGTYN